MRLRAFLCRIVSSAVNGMCTLADPARGLYERLATLEHDPVVSLSFTPGFPAADFPECGAAVWGYGFDEAAVTAAVETLAAAIVAQESDWDVHFLDPDEAVREAMRIAGHATRPVVIADTQDNPGVGGEKATHEVVVGQLTEFAPNNWSWFVVGKIVQVVPPSVV